MPAGASPLAQRTDVTGVGAVPGMSSRLVLDRPGAPIPELLEYF